MALLVARLGIPSFVVSLAYFLGLRGAMLLIIGEGGTIGIRNDQVLSVMNKNMPVGLGWLLAPVIIVGFAGATYWAIMTRKRAGLPTPALSVWGVRVGALAVVVLVITYLLNQERQRANAPITIQGVPWVVPLVVLLVVVLTFLLARTSLGRHIYAVGGNAEAARRAGIGVANVKTVCFILCSTLAIVAGILLASRDNSVSPTTGGAQTLLYAVGAAVIGGTSLFGGRGRIYDAVTGGLVVAIIANGLPLVTQKSGVQFIINGLVLLLAASVDAISRRRAAATGR
jgi:D-xylose transport system permease protein